MHKLENDVTLACKNFTDEGITKGMFAEAKVIRLGEIVEGLHKKVAKLEAHVKPNTLPEVLEERRMTTAEAVKKI